MARKFKHANPLINPNGSICMRPCTVKNLANLYGVSYKTMRSWLKPFKDDIGEHESYVFTIRQLEIIFEKIGKPQMYDLEKEVILA